MDQINMGQVDHDQGIETQKANGKNNKLLYVGASLVAILVFVSYYTFFHASNNSINNQQNSLVKNQDQNNTNSDTNTHMKNSISFSGNTYIQSPLGTKQGTDYASVSNEWVKEGEFIDSWNTLLTTHVMTPLDSKKPLSAESYAQNVVALQKSNGAKILETSIINTKDAADIGVDITNPPFVIVYVFPGTQNEPAELNIQRISNASGGKVKVFIFAKRIEDSKVSEYLNSKTFSADREAVILNAF